MTNVTFGSVELVGGPFATSCIMGKDRSKPRGWNFLRTIMTVDQFEDSKRGGKRRSTGSYPSSSFDRMDSGKCPNQPLRRMIRRLSNDYQLCTSPQKVNGISAGNLAQPRRCTMKRLSNEYNGTNGCKLKGDRMSFNECPNQPLRRMLRRLSNECDNFSGCNSRNQMSSEVCPSQPLRVMMRRLSNGTPYSRGLAARASI